MWSGVWLINGFWVFVILVRDIDLEVVIYYGGIFLFKLFVMDRSEDLVDYICSVFYNVYNVE